jgi:hypothetical protein
MRTDALLLHDEIEVSKLKGSVQELKNCTVAEATLPSLKSPISGGR